MRSPHASVWDELGGWAKVSLVLKLGGKSKCITWKLWKWPGSYFPLHTDTSIHLHILLDGELPSPLWGMELHHILPEADQVSLWNVPPPRHLKFYLKCCGQEQNRQNTIYQFISHIPLASKQLGGQGNDTGLYQSFSTKDRFQTPFLLSWTIQILSGLTFELTWFTFSCLGQSETSQSQRKGACLCNMETPPCKSLSLTVYSMVCSESPKCWWNVVMGWMPNI